MTHKRFILLLFSMSLLFSGLGIFVVNAISALESDSQSELVDIKFFEYKNKVAVGGYDVVAYFKENAAIRGEKKYSANFAGMPWHFSSPENRDAFMADPAAYIPKYGGHCAYGVAQGYLVRGDPEAWTIKDNQLYLNYNKPIRNAWLASVKDFIRRSENNWRQLNAPQ